MISPTRNGSASPSTAAMNSGPTNSTFASQSLMMYANSRGASRQLTGVITAPAFAAPSSSSRYKSVFLPRCATRSPGRTPIAISPCATWLARVSSCSYVVVRPSNASAGRCGVSRECTREDIGQRMNALGRSVRRSYCLQRHRRSPYQAFYRLLLRLLQRLSQLRARDRQIPFEPDRIFHATVVPGRAAGLPIAERA